MAKSRRRGGGDSLRRLGFELLESRRMLAVDIALISRAALQDTSADGVSYVYGSAISADGRYVAFSSNATNLVDGIEVDGNDSLFNVYRYDRLTEGVVLISMNMSGTGGGNATSVDPTISADGNIVAFRSGATNLADGHGNARYNVFVRDVEAAETYLVSPNSDGTLDGDCFNPIVSANGNVVSFTSTSQHLHPLKTAANRDVFAWTRETQTVHLVSVNAAGTASGNSTSYNSGLSADGRIVVFKSESNNLHPLDLTHETDVYARDLSTGTTHLISVASSGTSGGNGWSEVATVSADGNRIAFVSSATNLHPLDTVNWSDVYVRDLSTNTTQLVTVDMFGTAASNAEVSHAVISADGRMVAFESTARNLHPLDNELTEVGNNWDVYVCDIETGIIDLVSVNSVGTAGGNGDGSSSPAISADGSVVAFMSASSDLDPFDLDYVPDVYSRNLKTGTTELLSKNRIGPASGYHEIQTPIISANGNHVAFFSNASGLVANDFNNQTDAFITTLSWNVSRLQGDYNRDHFVDGADYSVWRDALGASGLTPYSGADGDGDGTVDQDDYLVWKANFGRVIGAGSVEQGAGSGAVDAGYGPQAADESSTAGQVLNPPWRASSGTQAAVDAGSVLQAADESNTAGQVRSGKSLASSGTRRRGLELLSHDEDRRRTQKKPPAEPGAAGRSQFAVQHRDLALLAWRSSWVARWRGQGEGPADDSITDRSSQIGNETDWVFEELGLGKLSLCTQ